ncbi:MAG: beta-ketoacyl-[acyl-carrier-protein] synthase family protein [Acidobacteriota bacterium]|nr:beta-ketoacyl-[acyl-carrier-protein] synthase family protein [Acidobacteriota bacterium]
MGQRRRVVITGMGAVSSIGTGLEAVEAALRVGRSGLSFVEEWKQFGILSHVGGVPQAEPDSPITTRRMLKSSTSNALMALRASWETLTRAGLQIEEVRGTNLAVLIGSGTGSTLKNYISCRRLRDHKTSKRVSAYTVPHVMGSTASANVSVSLGVTGESWAVSSACSTGTHAIGLGALLIRSGLYDQVLAGASDELDWTKAVAFDSMRALSRGFNDQPERASRPFDKQRDGFVISGGAGVLLLEELDAARRRGAPVLAEVLGYAANSDGHDMVLPLWKGASSVMGAALTDAGLDPRQVDYVNAHGTATPQGDPSESLAMKEVYESRQPWISSTKSTTGHPIGPAGSLEAIYTVLMLRGGFLAPNMNLDDVDDECAHLNLVTDVDNGHEARIAMSNSFGFGGTNASLVLRRWD